MYFAHPQMSVNQCVKSGKYIVLWFLRFSITQSYLKKHYVKMVWRLWLNGIEASPM